MAMPHNLTIENSHQPTKELLCFNGSSHGNGFDSDSPSSNEAYSPSLHSSSCSPSDSYSKPLCKGTPPKKAQYDSDEPCGIKFVPSEKEHLCGWGAFTPRFLQHFNTPKGVLFFLCVASFLQGMIVNGFINTVITSIERRFDLRSYHSGTIASSYDIAACVCLTFVSYFGGNGHKPHWLGWGALIMGIGSVVFALPHFMTSQYEVHFSEQTGMCHSNQTLPCTEGASSLSNYRFLFMFGQFLHGVGATPLYTLGVTYLDENVKSNYSPVYIDFLRSTSGRKQCRSEELLFESPTLYLESFLKSLKTLSLCCFLGMFLCVLVCNLASRLALSDRKLAYQS